jgi:hypothetical protein
VEHQTVGDPQFGVGSKVAVLIDGDNVGVDFAESILMRARRLGQIIVKRVYVDTPHLVNWIGSGGFSLQATRVGPNAADILLTIDAVDLAHRGDLSAIVLVSSDGGFAPLARFLVERGLNVLGLGSSKSPPDWRDSCTRFEVLDSASTQSAAQPKESSNHQPASFSAPRENSSAGPRKTDGVEPSRKVLKKGGPTVQKLDEIVLEILRNASPPMMSLSAFGQMMADQGITRSDIPERQWQKYFASRSDQFDLDPKKGPGARVRCRHS